MSHNAGRHRAPGRYNPVAEIGQIATQASTPLVKGSAVLAASGGLVAAIAIPAQAAVAGEDSATASSAQTASESSTVRAATAVTAPKTADSAKATADLGKVEVEPVAKPTGPTPYELRMRAEREAERQAEAERAAEAQQAERDEESASRSAERESTPSTGSASSGESKAPASSNSSSVISIAKQYIGVPYVFGGSTPSGFDCSGFTQYVFNKAGKSLPRVTTAQQAAATPVSDPQPGDLVFFGSPSYHVGIYLGDGMMIDAPRTGSSISIRPVFDGVSGYGRV